MTWPNKHADENRRIRHEWQIDEDDSIVAVTATATGGMNVVLRTEGNITETFVSGGIENGVNKIKYTIKLESGQSLRYDERVNLIGREF